MTRLKRLQAELERPLLVTSAVNVRYLTGLKSSNTALLVERERARLFTDFRYLSVARALEEVEVVGVGRDLLGELGRSLEGEVGFEPDALTVSGYEKLRAGGLELVASGGLVERMRAVKEEGELKLIRRAAAVTSEAFTRLGTEPFIGRSERELAWRMRELFHELGAEGEAFSTIAASGPNSAFPHAEAGERVVEAGELVVVDAGAVVDGYCADCTRTFASGDPPERLLRAYAVCQSAQQAGLDALRAGAFARDVDVAARAVIKESEFAGCFGHGLGHGVGLEVHEEPSLRPEAGEKRLEVGNVVTVEPGIYIEGLGGVRLEDLVCVGVSGVELLTSVPRELVRVG